MLFAHSFPLNVGEMVIIVAMVMNVDGKKWEDIGQVERSTSSAYALPSQLQAIR